MVQQKITTPCLSIDSGKEFRRSLRKPCPNITNKAILSAPNRVVPGFTMESIQHNTTVLPPKKCGVWDPSPSKPTAFKHSYKRGEFPVSIQFTSSGNRLSWRIPIENLDFDQYLPMLFEGMSEGTYPFNFIVERGIHDLITKGSHKVLPVLPQLIIPIRNALKSKRPKVICHALKCIIMLVSGCDHVGEALVPYYKHILPSLNLYLNYGRSNNVEEITIREESVSDLIDDCLQVLERYGGPDAYINLKYQIPTYESVNQ